MDQVVWSKPSKANASFVSINKDFLNMSVGVIKHLGMPKHVRLGISEEDFQIVLQASHELDELAFRVQKNRIIYCRSFLKHVRETFQIDDDVINRLKTNIIDNCAYVTIKRKK